MTVASMIHYGGQHAHVVGLSSIHTRASTREPAPNIAAPDNNRNRNVEAVTGGGNCLSDGANDVAIDAVANVSGERFAGDL